MVGMLVHYITSQFEPSLQKNEWNSHVCKLCTHPISNRCSKDKFSIKKSEWIMFLTIRYTSLILIRCVLELKPWLWTRSYWFLSINFDSTFKTFKPSHFWNEKEKKMFLKLLLLEPNLFGIREASTLWPMKDPHDAITISTSMHAPCAMNNIQIDSSNRDTMWKVCLLGLTFIAKVLLLSKESKLNFWPRKRIASWS